MSFGSEAILKTVLARLEEPPTVVFCRVRDKLSGDATAGAGSARSSSSKDGHSRSS